ncbi:MAG: IclR family transcriptional regulator [Actinomycetota bacterium]|nr:IclR family transcriptional regulator [Actinomycetota bacterium]
MTSLVDPSTRQPDPPGPAPDTGRPVLQVLERTFAVLEAFDETRSEWGASELARAVDLPVPTVHRLLMALRQLGYVTQDRQTKRFRLGPSAVLLGSRARAVADLRTVALEPVRHLSRELGETALLTGVSPDRSASVCLERVESPQPLRLSVEPGRLVPLHAGASQKALLAFMPEEEAERVISGRLARLCQSTLTDKRRLRADLDLIRRRGFATSLEETNVGAWGVAVPILSGTDVVCAVGVAGPSVRLSGDVVRRSVRRTHAAAAEIAQKLAYEVPRLSLVFEAAELTQEAASA